MWGQYDDVATLLQRLLRGWPLWRWTSGPSPGERPAMRVAMHELEAAAARKSGNEDTGWACAWLCACGYRGIDLLLEALADPPRAPVLAKTVLGVDGEGVSAVFLAPRLVALAREHGRITYRNARHGLYVLPHAVRANLAIGCPVDAAFHIGGERESNPYAAKLAAAAGEGIEISETLWGSLQA
jgi:hypothetical protein